LSLLLSKHPPTPYIYTLSLHDALPILKPMKKHPMTLTMNVAYGKSPLVVHKREIPNRAMEPSIPPMPIAKIKNSCFLRLASVERSEEHTSELQSRFDLVCRLLLEKKK